MAADCGRPPLIAKTDILLLRLSRVKNNPSLFRPLLIHLWRRVSSVGCALTLELVDTLSTNANVASFLPSPYIFQYHSCSRGWSHAHTTHIYTYTHPHTYVLTQHSHTYTHTHIYHTTYLHTLSHNIIRGGLVAEVAGVTELFIVVIRWLSQVTKML